MPDIIFAKSKPHLSIHATKEWPHKNETIIQQPVHAFSLAEQIHYFDLSSGCQSNTTSPFLKVNSV